MYKTLWSIFWGCILVQILWWSAGHNEAFTFDLIERERAWQIQYLGFDLVERVNQLLGNPKPRYLISFGLDTLLLVILTLRPSLFSMYLLMLAITLSAALLLPTKMMQSSAYRVKRSPLASSSLSSSLSMILLRSGLRFPPYVDKDIMPS